MEYSWDTESPVESRVHTFHRAVKICPAHNGNTEEQVYEKVKEENPRKNKALDEIVKLLPNYSKTDSNGNVIPDLEKITWLFDGSRNLKIDLIGASKNQKDTLKSVIASKLNKVEII